MPSPLVRAALCAALLAATPACFTVPATGLLATELRGPVSGPAAAPEPGAPERVGTAECYLALGLFAHGDASIAAAMRNGELTRVHHVDYEYKNLLGLFAVYTTLVYGE